MRRDSKSTRVKASKGWSMATILMTKMRFGFSLSFWSNMRKNWMNRRKQKNRKNFGSFWITQFSMLLLKSFKINITRLYLEKKTMTMMAKTTLVSKSTMSKYGKLG